MLNNYAQEAVMTLLNSDFVTQTTKQVLQQRLEKQSVETPTFFEADAFITLKAVCMRLIPQPTTDRIIDLAGSLDENLTAGIGNGWRYNTMPPDNKAFTLGLNGINQESNLKYGQNFHLLEATKQDEVLTSIQSGDVAGLIWKTLPAPLFFEELLVALVEIYYSHPITKSNIGDVSFADAKGWTNIGLNKLDSHEPQQIKKDTHASN
jgi:gluconate 2-dehydrogenase gamma chain